jgi:hypothetical protein
MKRTVTKGCPHGSCCGPGFWNIMYNALLNLDFSSHTKVIAFSDDLGIMTKGNTPSEAEVFENSTILIYLLGKSAKRQWGLDHKSLKTIYEGALIPLLTYGAPVWEEAVLTKKETCACCREYRD